MNLNSIKKIIPFQFIKFGIVGTVNTILHISILYILAEFFLVYYVIASLIGFVFVVTFSFTINTLWTFKQNIKHKTGKRYTKFFTVSLCAMGVNLFLLFAITETFQINYLISQLIATFVSLSINFFGNKYWTYRR